MGYHSLPKSDVSEPTLSANAFPRRCAQLSVRFSKLLDESRGEIAFFPEISNSMVFVLMGGRGSEVIERNAGPDHSVVKLCGLGEDVYAWAGFREEWVRTGRERKFRFKSAGFTFHAGREGEIRKPQILRSEWVSRRSSEFRTNVGHPHWQIDVLETFRLRIPEESSPFTNGADLGSQQKVGFGDSTEKNSEVFRNMRLERMHLASVAPWWMSGNAQIAYSPSNVDELDRWIVGCISYTRRELMRC